jgi:hypothetical protein
MEGICHLGFHFADLSFRLEPVRSVDTLCQKPQLDKTFSTKILLALFFLDTYQT